ncbi:Ig-like domain-containing protein [Arsenophonus nasoniae]|uniref:Ig-like domain-containing protein n=1 Tax=Arsenophonus nasoniae TaxID=638 RepID=A0ABY8NYG6_9GAMM|nr:Ig-like domain-containing protein [Arsenophonus nasoniae]WGM08314.1 Ig-like domain-containing protein [Arsenophonus nasoniae]
MTATVTDSEGNRVSNIDVTFTVSAGATIEPVTGKTDADGKATAKITSKKAGSYAVTATVNGKDTTKKTTFRSDKETAEITEANLVIDPDNSPANGKAENVVTATVTDSEGNRVSNIDVTFTVSAGATIEPVTGKTDADGKATAKITSKKAGSYAVTATVNGKDTTKKTTFRGDKETAEITEANLVIDPDNSPANGKAENVVTATVTDSEGNRVSNIDVTFTVSDGATIGPVTGKTDADGKATAKITSKKAGSYAVTATVNGKDTTKKTTFRGDKETAEITEANLVIDPDNSPANGKAENVVTATVTDSEGNRVSNIDVTFTVSAGATIEPVTGKTDADGKATAKITSKKAGSYAVTATVNGKDTTKKTTFRGDKETAEITEANLVIDPDNSPANGKAENVVTATVTDSEGNRVSNIDVTFTVSAGATIGPVTGKTDADGKATAKITSKKAGSYAVTATVNGKDTTKKTTFRGDKETAEITEANLVIDPDNSPANGKAENVVTATVTDSEGNRVSNIDVTFTVSAGATIEPVTGKTDADGKATAKITSKKAGSYAVTATVNGKDTIKKTTFRGDKETAEITEANLVIDPDNSPANGKAENVVTATVTDSEGNRVSNIDVTFTVSAGATIEPVTGKTDADGKATAKITSKKAGSYAVTATVNGKDTTKKTTFRGDKETAEITEANLVIDPDNSPANGKAENVVTATVTDSEGNRVSNIDVTFTVSDGATIEPVTGKTDADGKATAKITSKKAGSYTVTATVNGKDTTKKTTFRGDKETAEITEANLVIDPDNSPANGKAENVVTATVTDSEGNRVSNIDVTFTVSDGATIGPVTGKTDADGKATAKITSKKAGSYAVTATVNGKDTTKKTTFRGDKETAEITEANLVIDPDNSPANGKAENVVTATVTDSEGNRVSNIDVTFTVSAGATIEPVTGKTDADGKATAKITSKKAGSYAVTATVNGKDTIKKTTFRGDKETAEITEANLVIDPDNSPANGKAENVVTATVTDSEGNRVSNIDVTFTVSAGATIEPVTGKTDADGKATAKITSKKAGSYAVTATVNGKDTTKKTTFRSDKETAEITEANLVIDPDNSPANGKAENVVTATVTDSEGNRVSNIDVTFTVSDGATIEPVTGKTDADGKATAKITSKKAGSYTVTATVNGKDTINKTTFRGDKETAEINLEWINKKEPAVADKKEENEVKISVVDQYDNPIPFAKVHVNAPEISFQKDINTDINGIYNIKLKSDTFGEVKVNAKTESSSYEKSIKIIYIPNKFDLELNVNM